MRSEYVGALFATIAFVGVAYYGFSEYTARRRPYPKEQREEDERNALKRGDEESLIGLKWKDERNILHPDVRFDVKDGGTALHLFAEVGYPRCLKFLLDYGYDRKIKDYKGLTPADVARKYGHEKIAKLIETYTPVPPTPPTKEVDSADKPVLERVMKFFFDKKKRESEEEE